MGWVLGVAVIAAVAWIGVIVGSRLLESDRRRALEAEARALEIEAQALEATRPGARAEDPIEVASASQIEPRAEREPCPRCRGRFHVEAHEARSAGPAPPTARARDREPEVLRRVHTRCGGCGTDRVTWFRIRAL